MGLKLKDLTDERECYTCENSYVDEYTGKLRCKSTHEEYVYFLEQQGHKAAAFCDGYVATVHGKAGVVDNSRAIEFLLAGKSEFTAISVKTGHKIQYKITRKESTKKDNNSSEYIYFIKTKVGDEYVYAGILYYDKVNKTFKFSRGSKGNLDESHVNIKSILYILNNFHRGNFNLNVRIYHVGRCGRCGKILTTQESILTGLGPDCSKKLGIPRVKDI